MITFNYVALETNQNNAQFSELCNKFRELVMPSYTTEQVCGFLTNGNLRLLCAVLLYDGDRLAGFTTMGFYHRVINGKQIVIARMATGAEKNVRGGTLPLEKMWETMGAYKKLMGNTPMYFAGYIANPLMYNAVCEYTWQYYPRIGTEPPAEVKALLKELKGAYVNDEHSEDDFTFYAPFAVHIDEQMQRAIDESTNENVLYYKRLNPGYMQQQILVIIVPLTRENIKKSMEMVCNRRNNSRKAA